MGADKLRDELLDVAECCWYSDLNMGRGVRGGDFWCVTMEIYQSRNPPAMRLGEEGNYT